MWVAKIKILHKECIWSTGTKKFNVIDLFYRVTEYKEKNKLCLVAAHILKGPEDEINKYINFVKRDKRVKRLERKGNFMITLAKEDYVKGGLKEYTYIYNPAIFHIKAVIVKNGFEYWHVGCWEKKPLTDFIDIAIKKMRGELLQIQQRELEDLHLPHLMPKLTKKQKRALDLAIENGYYEFPRKTNLKGLAKLMGVSLPTYQEHLRKAEMNFIPNLTRF